MKGRLARMLLLQHRKEIQMTQASAPMTNLVLLLSTTCSMLALACDVGNVGTHDAGSAVDAAPMEDADHVADAAPSEDAAVEPPVDSGPVDSGPATTPDAAVVGAALPLGRVTNITASSDCPESSVAGTSCQTLTIDDCQGAGPIDVTLKTSDTAGAAGTVVLGTGGGGTAWYEAASAPLIESLSAAGYRVVQRRWHQSWHSTTSTEGPARAACRYATLLSWIESEVHSGGGFCITGNSGGSAEVSFAMARYGMGSIVDLAVPTGGPPHGRVDVGCLGEAAFPGWAAECERLRTNPEGDCMYSDSGPPSRYDEMWGDVEGACVAADPSWRERWHGASAWSPDAILSYPQTDVRFIFGTNDRTVAVPLGRLYAEAIESTKSVTILEGVGHSVHASRAGRGQLLEDIVESCVPRH